MIKAYVLVAVMKFWPVIAIMITALGGWLGTEKTWWIGVPVIFVALAVVLIGLILKGVNVQ